MASNLGLDIDNLFNHEDFENAFIFQTTVEDEQNWVTIPAYKGLPDDEYLFPYEGQMLLFSNDAQFEIYKQNYLFSTNYFDETCARAMEAYTDGYAMRVIMNMEAESLAHLDDSLGLMFSQFGY